MQPPRAAPLLRSLPPVVNADATQSMLFLPVYRVLTCITSFLDKTIIAYLIASANYAHLCVHNSMHRLLRFYVISGLLMNVRSPSQILPYRSRRLA